MTEHHFIWVITESPSDFPGKFVARRWIVGPKLLAVTDEYNVTESLDDARRSLPPGLACVPREPADPACMVESWI